MIYIVDVKIMSLRFNLSQYINLVKLVLNPKKGFDSDMNKSRALNRLSSDKSVN